MNDAHAGERAALYALGALDDADAAALEAHLRVCAECANSSAKRNETSTRLPRCKRAGERRKS